uniref:Protein IWS1 homolog A-like n=1 Tax=Saccoglossus kowalevskii TaxID=10224 RepID=A0ABM0MIP0_SACKO|nr:PREDICTED: protein IWS1 homolog A-like [Saccoglossus kowalevskii]
MATLAQVKAGKPQRKNFAGRPRSVASGISLPRKRQVIRRSEVLLDDQISLVRDVQDSLEKAMQELANAKTVEDVEFYRIKVNELKLQCDEMVLILQVIGKLNSELAYARLELEKLDKGDKNVAVIRKRVTWLEDRVENLLTRHKRSDTQSAMTSETTSYIYSENRQFQSPTHTGTEYELMNNQIGPSERSNSSIQFVKNIDNVEGFIDDDEIMKRSSIPSRTSSKLTQDGQLDVLDTVMKEPDDAPVRVKKQKRKKKTRRQKEMGAGDASTSRVSTDDEEEMVTIKPKSILKRPLSRGEADGREDDAKSEDSRSVRVCDKLPHEGGITDKLPIYKRDLTEVSVYPANSVTTTDEEFSDISQTDVLTDSQPEEDENSEDKSKSEAGIFMTESERESRQVVLKSPEQDGSKTAESKEETPKSRAESYWESDHHQFEFNENMNAILELDPLSYHAMGLAVPSTFTVSRIWFGVKAPLIYAQL